MRGHAFGIRRTNGSLMRHQLSVLAVLIAGMLIASCAATGAGAATKPVSRGVQATLIAVHWVRPGETLLGIAWRYRVTVDMIKQANSLWTDIILPTQRVVTSTRVTIVTLAQ